MEKDQGWNKTDLTSLDTVFKYIVDSGIFRALSVTKHNFNDEPLELNLTYKNGSQSNTQIYKDVMGLISIFYSASKVTPESFAIENSTDLMGDNG